MKHPKIDIAWTNDGWYGLYVDGKKVYEGDSFNYNTVLSHLGIEYDDHHANEALAEDGNCFPEDFADFVPEPEEG